MLNYKFSNFVSLIVYVQLLAPILSTIFTVNMKLVMCGVLYLIKIRQIILFANHLVISTTCNV